jgi:dihydrofolate reductase/thymidylate synthase
MSKSFSLIVAYDRRYGIGLNNTIPWKLPTDLKHFKTITTNKNPNKLNVVIMGKNTWNSLPIKPLSNRINIIVSTTITGTTLLKNTYFVNSFNKALELGNKFEDIFIIGGERIYKEALNHELCQILHLSILDEDYKCDTFFPQDYLYNFKIISDQINDNYIYRKCKRLTNSDIINTDEIQYLNLIEKVLKEGIYINDRTGIGRITLMGTQMRFNLENNTLPLLTTKKMFTKGIIGELLWMINGQTDSKILEKQGINIWKGNSSKQFLKTNNLNYDEGECGPIYGFQWRRFGANFSEIYMINSLFDKKITDIILDYLNINKGYDQIAECIRLIKEEPNSTRIIISGWNPTQLKEQVLPACHTLYQFYVDSYKKTLSCMLTLRSNDIGLGMPYNICSASLLTYMFAEVCNLKPKELIYSVGNYHIYSNHVEQLKIQMTHKPFNFPTFNFKRKINNIDNFKIDDFDITNYQSYPSIKMEMAV